jgi:hypothetical protein
MQPIKGAHLVNQTPDISGIVEKAVERQTGMGKNQQKALNVLAGITQRRKKDGDTDMVLYGEWREACVGGLIAIPRNRFKEASDNLIAKGIVKQHGDYVRIRPNPSESDAFGRPSESSESA